jgi:hypothetical protein
MIHLLADETPLSVLCSLVEPVVIYDPTGTRVIGHFTPVDVERGKRLYEELAARVDAAAIAGRKASGERGRTLAEVTERMKLAAQANGGQPVDSGIPSGNEGCATP